jgi:hypothetical protein
MRRECDLVRHGIDVKTKHPVCRSRDKPSGGPGLFWN